MNDDEKKTRDEWLDIILGQVVPTLFGAALVAYAVSSCTVDQKAKAKSAVDFGKTVCLVGASSESPELVELCAPAAELAKALIELARADAGALSPGAEVAGFDAGCPRPPDPPDAAPVEQGDAAE